eukprot:CAMPEP_0197290230 /NCGR_PEP_ID=MMETSP0890-20130614/7464_1 /TAXON_ID=44058 ORGANISM="Aureoumbra lagunensis, Strain CCMP1510" /NCGR_SAMPLE_ID=MMETSP0890 /ASSEMBLY_ACC=CAM_ASM_000533 /LENGTH=505 /DNA_ID=CAMNT_0042762119 /DNA_START=184 /DNA_END=1701 /DNA_ORIENTATION=+
MDDDNMNYGSDKIGKDEEDALAELLSQRLEEVKSGEILPQIRETSDDESIESEFARAVANLPPEEQRASTRREIENIFEVAQGEVRDWAENFKEERRQRTENAKQRVAEEMAAEQRSFEMKLDALVSEDAGIDKAVLQRALSDVLPEDDIVNELIHPRNDDVSLYRETDNSRPWPPPAGAVVSIMTGVASGKKPLIDSELIAQQVRALGYSPLVAPTMDDAKAAAVIVICDDTFANGQNSVKTAIRTLEAGGNLVVASRQGATQLGNLALAWKNARSGGGVTKARETEDCAKLAASALDKAISISIVRFGDIVPSDKNQLVVTSDDSLDAPISIPLAARALAQAALVIPAARNTSFSISGGEATEIDWQDEFLKLKGPELLRLDAASDANLEELILWLSEWATLFRQPYSQGLTTPVDIITQDDGAILSFYDKQQRTTTKGPPNARRRIPKLGGIRILAESNPRFPSGLRIRALRQPYDPDVAVKEMSEQAILDKLKRDFTSQWA